MKDKTSYEDAVKAKELYEDELFRNPNVSSVAIVEEADEFGSKTGSYIVRVGVISAEEYEKKVQQNNSTIPSDLVIKNDNKGEVVTKHVKIAVVKTGIAKALSQPHKIASATNQLPKNPELKSNTRHKRPTPCGYSISHFSVTAGTLGLVLSYTSDPSADYAYILSNSHVLAPHKNAKVDDEIIQPGTHDGGIPHANTIAHLTRRVNLDPDGYNYVDAAIAQITGGKNWKKLVSCQTSNIGYPQASLGNPEIGMEVEKSGRTTGYTQGVIISVSGSIRVMYDDLGLLTFKDQIITSNMSKPGDSGSCLLEKKTKKPVGLLFAGNDEETYHNHMDMVLNTLAKEQIIRSDEGQVRHVHQRTGPLQIVTRQYSTTPIASTVLCPQKQLYAEKLYRITKRTRGTKLLSGMACVSTALFFTSSRNNQPVERQNSEHSRRTFLFGK